MNDVPLEQALTRVGEPTLELADDAELEPGGSLARFVAEAFLDIEAMLDLFDGFRKKTQRPHFVTGSAGSECFVLQ